MKTTQFRQLQRKAQQQLKERQKHQLPSDVKEQIRKRYGTQALAAQLLDVHPRVMSTYLSECWCPKKLEPWFTYLLNNDIKSIRSDARHRAF